MNRALGEESSPTFFTVQFIVIVSNERSKQPTRPLKGILNSQLNKFFPVMDQIRAGESSMSVKSQYASTMYQVSINKQFITRTKRSKQLQLFQEQWKSIIHPLSSELNLFLDRRFPLNGTSLEYFPVTELLTSLKTITTILPIPSLYYCIIPQKCFTLFTII